jgi:hypothetical protein
MEGSEELFVVGVTGGAVVVLVEVVEPWLLDEVDWVVVVVDDETMLIRFSQKLPLYIGGHMQ